MAERASRCWVASTWTGPAAPIGRPPGPIVRRRSQTVIQMRSATSTSFQRIPKASASALPSLATARPRSYDEIASPRNSVAPGAAAVNRPESIQVARSKKINEAAALQPSRKTFFASEDLDDPHGEVLVDDDDFALGDQLAIHEQIHGL